MAGETLLGIFFGRRKGKIGSLEIEVTIREAHEWNSEVTQYPIETGSVISDHIINRPRRVSIDGIFSETPLGDNALLGAVQGVVNATNLISGEHPASDALSKLKEFRDKRETLTLTTGLEVYSDMAIERLSFPRDRSTGQALQFSADFVEIIQVSADSTNIPSDQLSTDAVDTASSAANVGSQVAKDVADPNQIESILYKITHPGE